MFARRALSKINELHELELASVNGEQGAQALAFREATIKVNASYFCSPLKGEMLNSSFKKRSEQCYSSGLYSKAGEKPKVFSDQKFA